MFIAPSLRRVRLLYREVRGRDRGETKESLSEGSAQRFFCACVGCAKATASLANCARKKRRATGDRTGEGQEAGKAEREPGQDLGRQRPRGSGALLAFGRERGRLARKAWAEEWTQACAAGCEREEKTDRHLESERCSLKEKIGGGTLYFAAPQV